jgi:hypothetical protein
MPFDRFKRQRPVSPRVAWLVLGLTGTAVHATAQPVRVDALGAADATLRADLYNLAVVRELKDGKVLLSQGSQSTAQLYVADFSSGTLRRIGRYGRGPNEYTSAGTLLSLKGDSTLLAAGIGRWLFLKGTRIVRTTAPDDPVVLAAGLPRGADSFGRILASGIGSPVADSTTLRFVNRRTAASTAAVTLRMASEDGYPPHPARRSGGGVTYFDGPWQSREIAVLFIDGWLAVARHDPYRVDWLAPTGQWIHGKPLPARQIAVNDAEKRAYAERLRAASDGSAKSSDDFAIWPKWIPAFEASARLLGTCDGNLVIPRTPTLARSIPLYDVVNRQGALERQITLRQNQRIVGFGVKKVYVVTTDDNGIERLSRHSWP